MNFPADQLWQKRPYRWRQLSILPSNRDDGGFFWSSDDIFFISEMRQLSRGSLCWVVGRFFTCLESYFDVCICSCARFYSHNSRNLTAMRQLSLELSCWDVGRIFTGLNLGQFVNQICTTSELLTSESIWTSTILSALLYNFRSWTFLLAFIHISFCDASQSEHLDNIYPKFLQKLISLHLLTHRAEGLSSRWIWSKCCYPLLGCTPLFWQLPQN